MKPFFYNFFAINTGEKIAHSLILHQNSVPYIKLTFFSIQVMRISLRHAKRDKQLRMQKGFEKSLFCSKIFGRKIGEKSENYQPKTECNKRFLFLHLINNGIPNMGY